MKDIQAHLERLRVQIPECELIRDLATTPEKQELFARLADHLKVLAAELERAFSDHRHDDGKPSKEDGLLQIPRSGPHKFNRYALSTRR